MHPLRTIAIPLAVAALTVPLASGAATAKPIDRGTFQDQFTETVTDFCDVPGLTVRVDTVADVSFRVGSKGRSQLPYYTEHLDVTQVLTNLANGKSVTSKDSVVSKDFKVTDNGDGTSTVQVLATGNSTLFNTSGKPIARNPGQARFSFLIDNGGTPTDPTDDDEIEFLGVDKESTGRTDNFCDAFVPAVS